MLNLPEDLEVAGIRAIDVIKEFLSVEKFDDEGNNSKVFYSPKEWKQRGEEYGRESLLIIVYDGSYLRDFFSMNACYDNGIMTKSANPYEKYEALQAKLGESGLFFEECTNWYSAVYRV